MKTKPLYKFERDGGGITVSPIKPEGKEYAELIRLIAEEGKILVNGDRKATVADVESTEGWTEIDKSVETEKEDELKFYQQLRQDNK